MSTEGYKIKNKSAIHFITFTVVQWVDIFTRKLYRDILIDNLKYCQKEKDLLLHAWCLMSNHIHMIMSSKRNDPSGLLRDFKKHTSKKIVAAIENNPLETRKDWMIPIFREQGAKNSRNTNFQLWQQDNHPEELYSDPFTRQKLNYTHNNPVKAGIVYRAEDYLYSSAKDYYLGKKCGLIEVEFL
jgi:putative transposase